MKFKLSDFIVGNITGQTLFSRFGRQQVLHATVQLDMFSRISQLMPAVI